MVVAVLAGGAILFPSLAFLFGLTLTGRFQMSEQAAPQITAADVFRRSPGLLARLAIACLIAGVGLLNLANAAWAHAVGLVFLFGFGVTAFLAVVSDAVRSVPETASPE